jgi:short subunit dehydrogenase-like uncharacterized protein
MATWMIYGAYGYTGTLLAEEAVRRGHRPLLAGRSEAKLKPLAQKLDLPYCAFDLKHMRELVCNTAEVQIVLHAAGPFIQTAAPMRRACIETHTHYLDITGEYPVFADTFADDHKTKAARVALISGVGFDVVPTDCLARYVADQVPDADRLEIAFAAIDQASGGTARSGLELLSQGGRVRRDGELAPYRIGKGPRLVRFPDRARTVLPIPWGDLVTAYHTTGIPNITTMMAFPRTQALLVSLTGFMLPALLRIDLMRNALRWLSNRVSHGPDEQFREIGRSYVWAKASAPGGKSAEAWLASSECYKFTVDAAIRAVERLLAMDPIPTGALTPAQAFGADFVLDMPDTTRYDSLPGR